MMKIFHFHKMQVKAIFPEENEGWKVAYLFSSSVNVKKNVFNLIKNFKKFKSKILTKNVFSSFLYFRILIAVDSHDIVSLLISFLIEKFH